MSSAGSEARPEPSDPSARRLNWGILGTGDGDADLSMEDDPSYSESDPDSDAASASSRRLFIRDQNEQTSKQVTVYADTEDGVVKITGEGG